MTVSRSTMSSHVLGEATLTTPFLPKISEVLTPEERFQKSFTEIKEHVRAHGWDAAAMFFGTAAYMGVYYLEDYFSIFGATGRYIVHNLAMGITANAVAVPFVRKARLCEGQSKPEANKNSFRYFLLCSVPDSLYQPVEDWFIAITKSGSPIRFEFIQDAVAEFSPVEIAASFSMFGVGFGLLYFVMKKILIKHDDAPEEVEKKFEDRWQQFYKKAGDMLQTPGWESIKSALQYFIFYLSDYLFDLNLRDADLNLRDAKDILLNLLGCCVLMSGYSFVFDNLPELFGYLQIRRERQLNIMKENAESLDSDYVLISINDVEDELRKIGDTIEKIVETKAEKLADADEMEDSVSEASLATTESFLTTSSSTSSGFSDASFVEKSDEDDPVLVNADVPQDQNADQQQGFGGGKQLKKHFVLFKDTISAAAASISSTNTGWSQMTGNLK